MNNPPPSFSFSLSAPVSKCPLLETAGLERVPSACCEIKAKAWWPREVKCRLSLSCHQPPPRGGFPPCYLAFVEQRQTRRSRSRGAAVTGTAIFPTRRNPSPEGRAANDGGRGGMEGTDKHRARVMCANGHVGRPADTRWRSSHGTMGRGPVPKGLPEMSKPGSVRDVT